MESYLVQSKRSLNMVDLNSFKSRQLRNKRDTTILYYL